MITVLTKVFDQYLKTDFEDFTGKYILARGIFNLLEKNDYSKEDYTEIKVIEKDTHPKVKVSMYKLDRVINPSKGEFNTVDKKFTFNRNVTEGTKSITMTESVIQDYLCLAIRRVHEIVMITMKDFKIEQAIGKDDEKEGKEIESLFKA